MKKEFISKSGKRLGYLYSAPESSEELPLIIYIHGAGSQGNNLDSF